MQYAELSHWTDDSFQMKKNPPAQKAMLQPNKHSHHQHTDYSHCGNKKVQITASTPTSDLILF